VGVNAQQARKTYESNDGREIYNLARRHGTVSWIRHYEAKGYLAAIEGPEVKTLVGFIEYFLSQKQMTFMECSQAEDLWYRAKEVLAAFRKSVKP
jgi:hypothetical protein